MTHRCRAPNLLGLVKCCIACRAQSCENCLRGCLTCMGERGSSPPFVKELRGVTRVHQTDFSAQQPEAQAAPRLPFAHGDQERSEGAGPSSRQGPQASERVGISPGGDAVSSLVNLERLKLRREFLYVAQGWSERRRLVVVQGRTRPTARAEAGAGFTTTKKVGNSVVRNRARRRLREAARLLLPSLGVGGADYVFIARQETATGPWPRLLDDVESALLSLRGRLANSDAQRSRVKDGSAKSRPAT